MQYSTNFNMNKPERADQYNLDDWNENTDTIDTELKALQSITDSAFKTALLNFCYPIGSLYWSSKSDNPSTLFGGTWTQIKDRFVWAKGDNDTVNATGGAKTVTLTVNNLPSHNHSFTPSGSISITTNPTFTGTEHSHTYTPQGVIASTSGGTDNVTGGAGKHSHTTASQSTSTTGGGGEHSHYVGLYNNKSTTNLWYGGTNAPKPLALDGNFGLSANSLNINDSISNTSGFSTRTRVASSGWNFNWGSSGYDLRTGIINNHTHSYSHTHTTNEVANHAHPAYFTGTQATLKATAGGSISGGAYKFTGTASNTGNTGSGTAVDKMPPYVVKYCWERTA